MQYRGLKVQHTFCSITTPFAQIMAIIFRSVPPLSSRFGFLFVRRSLSRQALENVTTGEQYVKGILFLQFTVPSGTVSLLQYFLGIVRTTY